MGPVLFDLDGTLTDPEVGFVKAFEQAFTADGVPTPPRGLLRECIGPPLNECFQIMGVPEDRFAAYTAAYRSYYSETGLFENRMYPGVPEMLATLRTAGRELFVVTSKPSQIAARVLAHFSILESFSDVFGQDHPGSGGTKVGLLKVLLAEGRFDHSPALFVGDRKYDIAAARDAGVESAGVLWGFGSREELLNAGADHLVASPGDVPHCLIGRP